MASLTRKPTSKNWIAVITLADGRRTNRSTGTPDRKAAQKIADAFQERENDGKGKRLMERAVRKTLNEILQRHTGETLNNETVEQFLKDWLLGKENENTRERYQVVVDGFLGSLGPKSRTYISHISYKDVQAFLDKRAKSKVSSKTRSVEAKALSAAFNLAKRLQIIEENPVEKALALRPIKITSNQKQVFTTEEIRNLISVADQEWKSAILLGYYCGARLSDCVKMRWGNIDFKKGTISYFAVKIKKSVELPMHTALRSYLQDLYVQNQPNEFICPSLSRKSTSGKSGLSQMFSQVMKNAGIDRQQIDGQGSRKFSQKSFHSLRHTFNSSLANLGVSQEIRMKMIGHATEDINNKYTHIQIETFRKEIDQLPTF